MFSLIKFVPASAFFFIIILISCAHANPRNLEDEEVDEKNVLFASKAENVTSRRGDTVTFSCDIMSEDGKPIPTSDESIIIVWLKNELVQFAGSLKISKNPRLSVKGRSLVLAEVDSDDAGTYTCQLSTSGQPTLHHQLIVQTPPTVKAVKTNIVAKSGDDVVLQCTARGSPPPEIRWRLRDQPPSSKDTILTGNSLTLEQVSHRQAGKYVCIADNGVGDPAKATIEVDVMYKPVIKIEREWIHSGENSQAELTCVIHGQPNPKVEWLRNGVELNVSPYWTQVKEEGNTYTLELKNLKLEHFGTYTCRASNTIGTTEGIIELSGVAKKAEFTSDPNGNEEETYSLSWNVESYSPIKDYVIKYRKMHANETTKEPGEWVNLTVPAQKTSEKDAGSRHHKQTQVLRNLSAATQYEVVLQVVNTFGSNEAAEFKFATLGSTVSLGSTSTASGSAFTILTLLLATVAPLVLGFQ